MTNQEKFLEKFANEAETKFNFREGEMATPEFMEWMRNKFAAYDKAIEKDVRAMSRDEFKSKWLEKRMDVNESLLPNEDSNEGNRIINDGKRTVIWVINEMLADFDCIVEDKATSDDRVKEMSDWFDAQIANARDCDSASPGRWNSLHISKMKFLKLFG